MVKIRRTFRQKSRVFLTKNDTILYRGLNRKLVYFWRNVMSGLVRIGDEDSAKNKMVEGSSDVFVNGIEVCRLKDKDSAKNEVVTGSASVFVNNRPVCRIGDKDSAKHVKNKGSGDVFADPVELED